MQNFRIKLVAENLNLQPLYESAKKPDSILEQLLGYKTALKLYYNSNISLNTEVYSLAQSLKSRIELGETFQSLSGVYSQDDFSKAFGGETGRIAYSQLLPEVAKNLKNYKIGQVVVIPSRLGVHIIEVTSISGEGYQLQQIYLTCSGFETWLNTQLQKIKIKTIIKI